MHLSLLLAVSCLAAGSFASPFAKRIGGPFPKRNATGISCPPDFRNVVFNTDAPANSGWPGTTWTSIKAAGVSNWIGFTQESISLNPHYDVQGKSAKIVPDVDNTQIKVCMDYTHVDDAMKMITSSAPPTYLELYNEPDYSYMGMTLTSTYQEAASNLSALINTPTTTKFISPAVAFTNDVWLGNFFDVCAGCLEKVDIISAHIYNPIPAQALLQVTTLHGTFPNHTIWITELAPASSDTQGCELDENGMINWMQTLLPELVALGYVERIFWNHGENSNIYADDPAKCNPSLTNDDGTPTPLLNAYAGICS